MKIEAKACNANVVDVTLNIGHRYTLFKRVILSKRRDIGRDKENMA